MRGQPSGCVSWLSRMCVALVWSRPGTLLGDEHEKLQTEGAVRARCGLVAAGSPEEQWAVGSAPQALGCERHVRPPRL